MTRYRIFRKAEEPTTYIAAHEGIKLPRPQVFADLDGALHTLRENGIPEYEIRRIAKELGAINGAIVQLPNTMIFD